jgi:hypothetical protein
MTTKTDTTKGKTMAMTAYSKPATADFALEVAQAIARLRPVGYIDCADCYAVVREDDLSLIGERAEYYLWDVEEDVAGGYATLTLGTCVRCAE